MSNLEFPDCIINLIGGEDDEIAKLFVAPFNGECQIKFYYRNKFITGLATDYFESFCQIRLLLDSEKLIPFCYGASLNVYPSGMCRDMGGGMRAYRLKLGKTPMRDDLVSIFDQGADVIPATVGNQKKYFDDWVKSIAIDREK